MSVMLDSDAGSNLSEPNDYPIMNEHPLQPTWGFWIAKQDDSAPSKKFAINSIEDYTALMFRIKKPSELRAGGLDRVYGDWTHKIQASTTCSSRRASSRHGRI